MFCGIGVQCRTQISSRPICARVSTSAIDRHSENKYTHIITFPVKRTASTRTTWRVALLLFSDLPQLTIQSTVHCASHISSVRVLATPFSSSLIAVCSFVLARVRVISRKMMSKHLWRVRAHRLSARTHTHTAIERACGRKVAVLHVTRGARHFSGSSSRCARVASVCVCVGVRV